MKTEKPVEIPAQPDPGPTPPYQPEEPTWPITKPEIKPGKEPKSPDPPTEIPPPPER